MGEFKSKTYLLYVVLDKGAWSEVIPCPDPESMQRLRASKIQRDKEEARAQALASSLKDPLLSELKALLRQGQKIAAIRKYQEASKEDLATARQVIELLER